MCCLPKEALKGLAVGSGFRGTTQERIQKKLRDATSDYGTCRRTSYIGSM